jgi:1,4-alpha-glucan branching enzyme
MACRPIAFLREGAMGVAFGRVDRDTPMGGNLVAGGATFRTWAPRAHAVYLVGPDALPATAYAGFRPNDDNRLEPLGDGSWGGFVAGAEDGFHYLFWVDGAGSAGLKRDSFARELTKKPDFPASYCILRASSSYPWHDAGWRAPDFRDLIIYQLHVGAWWAVDAAGTDVRAERGGRFLDVAVRLPYLRALGVNAVQLLPIQEFPTAYSAGYNGVDYFSPEMLYQVSADDAEFPRYVAAVNALLESFGQSALSAEALRPGINQLKCLIDLAHLHGIAVILDLVYNHAGGDFGDRSLWFYDRFSNGDMNHSLYFTEQGWAGGLVFAFWNGWVREFLIDNAVMFYNEYRIDGIRYDEVRVISNNRPDGRVLCRDMTSTLRFIRPAAIQIAEYWDWDRALPVTPAPAGLGFDAALGDGLRDALRGLLKQAAGGEHAAIDLDAVARAFYPPPGYEPAWRVVQCIENHDITYAGHDEAARVAMLADPADRRSWYARSRSRVVASLLLAAPGIPALLMGQEILEDRLWSDNEKDHPGHLIRWEGFNSDRAMADFLRFMQGLVALRRTQPALRADGMRVSRVNNDDRVIVVHRWVADGSPGRDVVIVASLDEHAKHGYRVGLPFGGPWRELFNSDYYDAFPNPGTIGNGGQFDAAGRPLDGFAHSAALTIPANGVLFLARA